MIDKASANTASPSPASSTKAAQDAKDTAPDGKWVFSFGDGKAEGDAAMRNLLGGKGANLAEMANLGLPVPPGFTHSDLGLHLLLRARQILSGRR